MSTSFSIDSSQVEECLNSVGYVGVVDTSGYVPGGSQLRFGQADYRECEELDELVKSIPFSMKGEDENYHGLVRDHLTMHHTKSLLLSVIVTSLRQQMLALLSGTVLFLDMAALNCFYLLVPCSKDSLSDGLDSFDRVFSATLRYPNFSSQDVNELSEHLIPVRDFKPYDGGFGGRFCYLQLVNKNFRGRSNRIVGPGAYFFILVRLMHVYGMRAAKRIVYIRVSDTEWHVTVDQGTLPSVGNARVNFLITLMHAVRHPYDTVGTDQMVVIPSTLPEPITGTYAVDGNPVDIIKGITKQRKGTMTVAYIGDTNTPGVFTKVSQQEYGYGSCAISIPPSDDMWFRGIRIHANACVLYFCDPGEEISVGGAHITVEKELYLYISGAVDVLVPQSRKKPVVGRFLDYDDKERLLRDALKIDPRDTPARFWSKSGLGFGVFSPIPSNVEGIEMDTCCDGYFHSNGVLEGIIPPRESREFDLSLSASGLVVEGACNMRVAPNCELDCDVKCYFSTHVRNAHVVTEGAVRWFAGHDIYYLDDGGPSDNEGFPAEF